MPVHDPKELVEVHAARTPFDQEWLVSYEAYERLRASTPEVPLMASTAFDEGDLELSDGTVHVIGAKDASVSLAELARILNGAPGYAFPSGLEPGLDAMSNFRTGSTRYFLNF